MSNSSNLEDFSLILYEAANDECKFLCKLICMQIMEQAYQNSISSRPILSDISGPYPTKNSNELLRCS